MGVRRVPTSFPTQLGGSFRECDPLQSDPTPPTDPPPPSSLVHTHEITDLPREGPHPWSAPLPKERQPLTPYQRFRFSGCGPLRERLRTAMLAADLDAKVIDRYDACGSCSHLYSSESSNTYVIRGNFCKCRTCIPCARARSRLISNNLIGFLGDRHTRMTTLTLKHNGAPLPDLVTRIWESFKLLRKRPEFKARMRGWAAFLEVKWSTRSNWWHVHLHILSEGSWWDKRELSSAWHACTGDSMIVDIQAKGTNASRAYYASKYASKPFDAAEIPSPILLSEAVCYLHRRKLWQVGGDWKSLRLLAKPKSTVTDWEWAGSLNQIFADAGRGMPEAQALVAEITKSAEEILPDLLRSTPKDDTS